jgi:hypothetical protein
MNIVVSNAQPGWPGGALFLAEPVHVGDILRVGSERQFSVGVMQVRGNGPCEAVIGHPSQYSGLDSIPRYVTAGEPVEVVGRFGRQEQR